MADERLDRDVTAGESGSTYEDSSPTEPHTFRRIIDCQTGRDASAEWPGQARWRRRSPDKEWLGQWRGVRGD